VTVNAQDSNQSPRAVDRYIFPEKEIDAFIAWKRKIRQQKGGMTAIRAISRGEFSKKAVKTIRPKKEK
jgi:hypothetical protein